MKLNSCFLLSQLVITTENLQWHRHSAKHAFSVVIRVTSAVRCEIWHVYMIDLHLTSHNASETWTTYNSCTFNSNIFQSNCFNYLYPWIMVQRKRKKKLQTDVTTEFNNKQRCEYTTHSHVTLESVLNPF